MDRNVKTEKWFYTGHCMEDGKTPITVCAYNESQERRYILEGFRPIDDAAHRGQRAGKRAGRKRGSDERE